MEEIDFAVKVDWLQEDKLQISNLVCIRRPTVGRQQTPPMIGR